jgi:hypothetical protein
VLVHDCRNGRSVYWCTSTSSQTSTASAVLYLRSTCLEIARDSGTRWKHTRICCYLCVSNTFFFVLFLYFRCLQIKCS